MNRILPLLVLTSLLAGCRSYVESTPSEFQEGNHVANYGRIFKTSIPANVTVVNSAVAAYSSRPGVVTTDDFEFELVVPDEWIQMVSKRFYLKNGDDEFLRNELSQRREHARPWYAPGPLDQYVLYRDLTSVGYVHMLVQKEADADGRLRVFISKH